ncbi:helix-turn-helix transcriptional regulator [Vibrio wakamikoensis]|uniref:helix-turn-helix domain-containing protein n=1 Tax=Vibrio wakamikoensis TaxID=2910251 RepID=UPI003D1AF89A
MSKSQPLSELDRCFTEDELALVECKSNAMLTHIRLNELMRQLGITKAQLLESPVVTPEALERLENASSDLTVSQLNQYVRALGGKLTITLSHPSGDVVLLK